MQLILENREWIFSGVGVFLLSIVAGLFWPKRFYRNFSSKRLFGFAIKLSIISGVLLIIASCILIFFELFYESLFTCALGLFLYLYGMHSAASLIFQKSKPHPQYPPSGRDS